MRNLRKLLEAEVGIGRLKRRFKALHRHYPTQHFLNTFADVFADSGNRQFGYD
jgi:hypothetical protein